MHVTQRGVNRCAIFLDDTDRHHYRRLLRDACRKHGVAIHAFVLMDNHVHLFLSSAMAGCVSRALRQAGQTYVQSFNQRHRRIGTLWQGRFKSSLVDSDTYALRVIRYIELNPVRAAIPCARRWSNARRITGGRAYTHISAWRRIHCSSRIRPTLDWAPTASAVPRRIAIGCMPLSTRGNSHASAPT